MRKKIINLKRKLTVVVITHNRAADLARTLKNLTSLPEKVNIIVIDNGSTDRTFLMVESLYPSVNYIKLDTNEMAVGRNVGVEAATTPYVAFSDDDSWWKPYSLAEAVDLLDEYPNVGAVAAKIFVNENQKPDPINRYFETSPLTAHVDQPGNSLIGFLECAVVMRRKAYLEAGGYNERLKFSGEGALLAIDMVTNGWGISYVPDLVAYHYPSSIRNMKERHRMGARNAILRAWMRRPFASAVKETFAQIKLGMKDNTFALGYIDALWNIAYALKNRKVVPQHIEEMMHLLAKQDRELAQKAIAPRGKAQLAENV